MASYSRVHSHDSSSYYMPQPPRNTHHEQNRHNHGYSHLSGDSYYNIPLMEQGMSYRPQAPEIQTHHKGSGDQCCLKKPSNAISTASFGLGALSTAAHFILPKVPSLASNAAVIAAEKPLLYGGIGGMVLGVAIQLAKLCRGADCNGPTICIDPCGPAPDCSGCCDAACACCGALGSADCC